MSNIRFPARDSGEPPLVWEENGLVMEARIEAMDRALAALAGGVA